VTIRIYQGERASHTHENRMLESFIEAVRPRWEKSEDSLVMVSNAYWNQAEIDLVCILQTALVVIDFKAYRGKISVAENGPWMNGNVRIRGGSKSNPLIQIKDNKFSVINWLKRHDLLSHCNLGHISGAVVFDGSIDTEGELPANVSQWFSIIQINEAAAYLDRLASPQIEISDRDQDQIVDALGVPEQQWASHQVVDTGTSDDVESSRLPPIASQKTALETIQRFILDDATPILSVSGMTATGKSSLIAHLHNLNLGGRSVVVLAPNNRFATALARNQGVKASGLYHHIYDTNAPPKEIKVDKITVKETPLRGDAADPTDCIYVIDDAHIVTAAYFEPEPFKRFGSGRLAADFLNHARLQETDRKLIVLSDPYHVASVSDDDLLSASELWAKYGLNGQRITLNQLVRDDETRAIIDNALSLVRHIESNSFAEFDFTPGNGFALNSGQAAAEDVAKLIQSSPMDVLLVAYSNRDVTQLNDWARRKRFNAPSDRRVVPGDLLEMNSFFGKNDPSESRSVNLSPGDLFIVEEAGKVRRIRQPLKGRDEDVEFLVQEIRPSGSSISFHILVDFLLAESKEIAPDVWIASQVWSGSQESEEPVKVRFGYASTAHHARATRRLRAFIAPPKSIGRHNKAYFRWLYTAITRSTHLSVIPNWEPLNVFDGANFSESNASRKPSITIGVGLTFDPERPLTADEEGWAAPEGLPSESEELKKTVAVWLAIQPTLDLLGYEAVHIQHHPYQVQFTLRGSEGTTCGLKVSYKSNHMISSIQADDPEIQFQICEGVSSRIRLTADQTRIIKAIAKLPNLESIRIVSLKPTDYRIQTVVGISDEGLAELEFNYTGEGLVSSVRLLHYTDEAIRDRITRAFQNEEVA
jgi:hypothetical protein